MSPTLHTYRRGCRTYSVETEWDDGCDATGVIGAKAWPCQNIFVIIKRAPTTLKYVYAHGFYRCISHARKTRFSTPRCSSLSQLLTGFSHDTTRVIK